MNESTVSASGIRFLPRINPSDIKTQLSALLSGNSASRNGTAVRLSLTESHSAANTAAKTAAFEAAKSSPLPPPSETSVYTYAPSAAAGAIAAKLRSLPAMCAEMLEMLTTAPPPSLIM